MMNKINFYFDDKDVFDALQTDKRVSSQTLINFLKRRGIFFPLTTDRTFLCNYIATWFNDYSALGELSLRMRTKHSRAKYTNEELQVNDPGATLSPDQVSKALEKLKKKVELDDGVLNLTSRNGEKAYEAAWIRHEIDFTKTPLRQRTERVDKIYIALNSDGKLLVRTPTGDACAGLRNQLKDELEGNANNSISRFVIHLPENATADDRISFFMQVLTGIPELSLNTVTGISLLTNDASVDEDDLGIAEDEQNEMEFNQLLTAKLQGGKLLDTPEYKYLLERNFAPTEIRWWAKTKSNEWLFLSIGFLHPKEGTDFCCNVHGIRRKADNTGTLKKTVESVSREEHIYFMAMLENKAREVSRNLLAIAESKNVAPQA